MPSATTDKPTASDTALLCAGIGVRPAADQPHGPVDWSYFGGTSANGYFTTPDGRVYEVKVTYKGRKAAS